MVNKSPLPNIQKMTIDFINSAISELNTKKSQAQIESTGSIPKTTALNY